MQARDFVWLPLVAFLLASSGGQAASAQTPDRIARLIGDASVPNVNFAAGHANSVARIRDTGFRVVRTATTGDREAVVPAGAVRANAFRAALASDSGCGLPCWNRVHSGEDPLAADRPSVGCGHLRRNHHPPRGAMSFFARNASSDLRRQIPPRLGRRNKEPP